MRFSPRYGYIKADSLIGRKAGKFVTNSKQRLRCATEGIMDQVIEQVEQEVVELSLAELAAVGGGGVPSFE